jgi:outer membrane protein assembly factor BamD (BamD/ComL family)
VLKGVLIAFALLVGGIIGLHTVLQNGSLLKYLDDHPDPQWVPAAQYYIGQGYYIFQDLPNAATYFIRVPQRYPQSSLADDAYFNYVQSLDDMGSMSRVTLVEEYGKYLEKFPQGRHAMVVQNRLDAYKSGAR